jgi:hypothetical protein
MMLGDSSAPLTPAETFSPDGWWDQQQARMDARAQAQQDRMFPPWMKVALGVAFCYGLYKVMTKR